jgi:putative transposase
MDVKRTKGAVYSPNYHLVWCPKYRRSVLAGPVAGRLRQPLNEIATKNGFEVLACEVMPDHMPLFASAPPKYSPADLAKLFKGIQHVAFVKNWVNRFAARSGSLAHCGRRPTM